MSRKAGRPARLTFPAYDLSDFRIMADGKRKVGYVLGEFRGYRAYLWPEADPEMFRFNPDDLETVWRPRLGELRRMLRERVELKGPWWALPSPSAAEGQPRDGAGTSG